MSRRLVAIGRVVAARPKSVIFLWLLTVVVSVPLASQQASRLTTGGFEAPGSGSQRARDVLARSFPSVSAEQLDLLIARHPGASVADDERAARFAETAVRGIANVSLPHGEIGTLLAEDRTTADMVVSLEVHAGLSRTFDIATELNKRLESQSRRPVSLTLIGRTAQGASLQELSKKDLAKAEGVGFPLVLVILLAVFGSVLAALLPVSVGVVSVVVTGALVYLLANIVTMSVFVTNIASMIGIGVAVDYSLFVLARYREERAGGASAVQARDTAIATSGRAVVFSGATVMVAVATIFAIHSTVLRSIAAGAVIVVAVSVGATLTLTAAMITLLDRRLVAPGRVVGAVRARLTPKGGRSTGFWERWVARVLARPVLALIVALAVLLALAAPVLSIKLGDDTLRQLPTNSPARVALQTAMRATDGSAPLLITATPRGHAATAAQIASQLNQVAEHFNRDRAVRLVLPAELSVDGTAALVSIVPVSDPESSQTQALFHRVRGALSADRGLHAQATVAIGGSTADQVDLVALISHNLWKVIALVLALILIILALVLRSVVLPIKAVLLNLASVGAAYGVLTAVFQHGWLAGPLGITPLGHVQAVALPLILVVVFGLSTDYELFVLTRIRERYQQHGDNRRAVAEGLADSAQVITSAAAVMVGVFLVFTITGIPIIQEIGLGNAVAIAVDATITRLVLLPAAMQLLGGANWWFPGGGGRRAQVAATPVAALHPRP